MPIPKLRPVVSVRRVQQPRLCPTCGAMHGPCQKLLKLTGYYVDMKTEHKGRPPKVGGKMSDIGRRLSALRRDLHEWKDALVECRDNMGNHAAIKPSDVVTGIEKILADDQARIRIHHDITEFGDTPRVRRL